MRNFQIPFLVAALVLAATSVHSADILVVDQRGSPVRDVVVSWTAESTSPSPTTDEVRAEAASVDVDQIDKHYVPFVSAIAPGSWVRFPNSDDIRHHVYSFSDAKTFELKLYHAQDAEPVLFDQPGLVTLGCNVHDNMKAYVLVTASPSSVTDGEGKASTGEVEPTTVSVWHPQMTAVQDLRVEDGKVELPILWDSADPQAPPSKSSLEERFKRFRRNAN